jgi:hypothetical protein
MPRTLKQACNASFFLIHLCSLGLAHMPRTLKEVCKVCFAASMRCRSTRETDTTCSFKSV